MVDERRAVRQARHPFVSVRRRPLPCDGGEQGASPYSPSGWPRLLPHLGNLIALPLAHESHAYGSALAALYLYMCWSLRKETRAEEGR